MDLIAKAKELFEAEPTLSAVSLATIFLIFIGRKTLKAVLTHITNDLNEKIFRRFSDNITNSASSIIWRDGSKYRRLCQKYIRSNYIGGMKDYAPKKNLENIYINIKCGTVDLRHIDEAALVDRSSDIPISNREEILSFIESSSENNVLTLLGGPGSGKTTVINHLLTKLLKKKNKKQIPIPLIIRDIEKHISDPPSDQHNLLTLTEKYFSEKVCLQGVDFFPRNWLSKKLASGSCVILIDGIDEVESEHSRHTILEWIKNEAIRNSGNKFIITSRPHGIKGFSIPNEIQRYICPLTKEDIRDFIQRWYKEITQDESKSLSRAEKESLKHRNQRKADSLSNRILSTPLLFELARKPMILTIMIIVDDTGNTLPDRRCSLYDRIMIVMLGGRNSAKGLKSKIPPESKEILLSNIAAYMTEKKLSSISKEKIIKISNSSSSDLDNPINTEDFLYEVVLNSGLLISTDKKHYCFCHSSFKDYLAAQFIRSKLPKISIKKIMALIENPSWTEAMLLLIGQVDASPIVENIVSSKDDSKLIFLLSTLNEAHQIDAKTREAVEKYIKSLIDDTTSINQKMIGGVFLKKRLKELSTFDEKTVSSQPIKNIEYAYYLLSTANESEHIAFKNGAGLMPVRVRSKLDADLFCKWLSNKCGDGWNYRIPNEGDIEEIRHPIHAPGFMYWTNDLSHDGHIKIYGKEVVDRRIYSIKSAVAQIMANDLSITRPLLEKIINVGLERASDTSALARDILKISERHLGLPPREIEKAINSFYISTYFTLKNLGENYIFNKLKSQTELIDDQHAVLIADRDPKAIDILDKSGITLSDSLQKSLKFRGVVALYDYSRSQATQHLCEYSRAVSNTYTDEIADELNMEKTSFYPSTISDDVETIAPLWLLRCLIKFKTFTRGNEKSNTPSYFNYVRACLYEAEIMGKTSNDIGIAVVKSTN